jgi:hypothetical protein
MKKLTITTIAISMLLIASGCSTNNQTAQQKEACTADDPHPWCMQLAQTSRWDPGIRLARLIPRCGILTTTYRTRQIRPCNSSRRATARS